MLISLLTPILRQKVSKKDCLTFPILHLFNRLNFSFIRTIMVRIFRLISLPAGRFVPIPLYFLEYWHINEVSQSPYMPSAAAVISQIPTGSIPLISKIDLLIFKMFSCGLRAQASKSRADANDAAALLSRVLPSPVQLTTEQRTMLEPFMGDVVTHSKMPEDWWRRHLGMEGQQSSSGQLSTSGYWTWSEKYQNHYHIHSNGTYEWAGQAESSSSHHSGSREHSKSPGKHRHR